MCSRIIRSDGAGVDRYASDTAAFLDDQDRFAQFGGLDGGAPSGRTTADNDEIVTS
jgi:hypothetical protein